MIPQFKEYIEEGLWSKGIDRSKSGEKRLGDITDFDKYVPTIKWVDMGHPEYLFAEYDFEKRGMSANEIEHLKLPEGVLMMSSVVFKELCKIKDIFKRATSVDNDITYKDIKFENKTTGNKIYFSMSKFSYISNLDMFDDEFSVDIISTASKNTKLNKYESYEADKPLFRIKLIKQKSMNEGLWSKGVERSQTGEIRIGDLNEIDNYIRNVKWVDLGHPKYLFSQKDLPSSPEKLNELLSSNEIGELIKKLPDGVSIMDLSLLKWIKNNCKVYSFYSGLKYENVEKNDYSYLNADVYYFLKGTHRSLSTDNHADVYINHLGYNPIGKYRPTIKNEFNEEENNKKCYCVKLIKQKSMNEGLWAKGVNRSQTGEERIENTNPQFERYLQNIEWMNMGTKDKLYAKIDFNEGMSINQIKNLKLPEGVEIMSGVDFYMLKGLCDISKKSIYTPEVDVKVFSVTNPRNKDKIYFNIDFELDYYTDFERDTVEVISLSKLDVVKRNKRDFDCPEYIFKLVKNNHINEGLWAKGVERSKNGEKRGENKHTILERICKFFGEVMSKRMEIPYSPNLCTYKELKMSKTAKSRKFEITCDFSHLFKPAKFSFIFYVKKDTKEDVLFYTYYTEFINEFIDGSDDFCYENNFGDLEKTDPEQYKDYKKFKNICNFLTNVIAIGKRNKVSSDKRYDDEEFMLNSDDIDYSREV